MQIGRFNHVSTPYKPRDNSLTNGFKGRIGTKIKGFIHKPDEEKDSTTSDVSDKAKAFNVKKRARTSGRKLETRLQVSGGVSYDIEQTNRNIQDLLKTMGDIKSEDLTIADLNDSLTKINEGAAGLQGSAVYKTNSKVQNAASDLSVAATEAQSLINSGDLTNLSELQTSLTTSKSDLTDFTATSDAKIASIQAKITANTAQIAEVVAITTALNQANTDLDSQSSDLNTFLDANTGGSVTLTTDATVTVSTVTAEDQSTPTKLSNKKLSVYQLDGLSSNNDVALVSQTDIDKIKAAEITVDNALNGLDAENDNLYALADSTASNLDAMLTDIDAMANVAVEADRASARANIQDARDTLSAYLATKKTESKAQLEAINTSLQSKLATAQQEKIDGQASRQKTIDKTNTNISSKKASIEEDYASIAEKISEGLKDLSKVLVKEKRHEKAPVTESASEYARLSKDAEPNKNVALQKKFAEYILKNNIGKTENDLSFVISEQDSSKLEMLRNERLFMDNLNPEYAKKRDAKKPIKKFDTKA